MKIAYFLNMVVDRTVMAIMNFFLAFAGRAVVINQTAFLSCVSTRESIIVERQIDEEQVVTMTNPVNTSKYNVEI